MAPSVVQTATASAGSATTLTVTLAATGAGNSVIVTAASGAIFGGVPAISGVQLGSAPLTAVVQNEDSETGVDNEIWLLDNIAGGQTSVTITWSNSNNEDCAAVVYEVSGLLATGSSDQSAEGNTDFGTSWTSGSTATLTQASEIAIGTSAFYEAGTITPPGSPWTNTNVTKANLQIESGYQVLSSNTGVGYAGTNSSSSGYSATAIATFKAGTPPSAQPDVPQIQPGPTWLATFKPGMPRPRPVSPPASPGPLLPPPSAQPDVPQIQPGPTWLATFKPGVPRPRPVSPPASYGPYLTNSAESVLNGQSASTTDSGGPSGNAWDQVDIGSGAVVKGDSSYAAHGNISYRISTGSTGVPADLAWSTQLGGGQPQLWFRLYLYFTQNPVNQHRLIEFTTGSFTTACGGLVLSTAGHLLMVDAGGTTRLTSTNAIPLGAWFRVEGFITGSATSGQLEFKLFTVMDGTTPLETQTSAAAFNTTGTLGSLKIGPGTYSVANVGPFWVDDIGVSASGYIGPASGFSINKADVPQINPGSTWLDIFKPGRARPRPVAIPSAVAVPLGPATVVVGTPAPSVAGIGVALGVATITISTPQISVGESCALSVANVTVAALAPSLKTGVGLSAATVAISTPGVTPDISQPLSPATVTVGTPAPSVHGIGVALGTVTVAVGVPHITPAITGLAFPRINPGPTWLHRFKPGLPKPRPFLPQRVTPGGAKPGVATVTIAVPAITPTYAAVVDLSPAAVTITAHPVKPSRTLLLALASQAGVDDYGNEFAAGITATAGTIQGVTISGSTISAATISGGTISGSVIDATEGNIGGYDIAGLGAEIANIQAFLSTLNVASPPSALSYSGSTPGTNGDVAGTITTGEWTTATAVAFVNALSEIANDTISYENALGTEVGQLITVVENLVSVVNQINTQLQTAGIFT